MSSHRKAATKLMSEASKKASKFAKQLGESMGCKKVSNHMGGENTYVRPEKKYDFPMHSRMNRNNPK